MQALENMKWLWFIVILSLTSQPMYSQAEIENEISFRVMTYNIKFDDTRDPINNWERRKDNVIGLLKYHSPVLFGTQEGLHHQLEDIKSGLTGFEYIGIARDDGKQKGEYSAFFYDTKRFKPIRSNTFWLSETPELPSKSWDAALPRICTWAEMQVIGSDYTFFIFNTHFDHIGELAREESIKLIVQQIKVLAGNKPVVLMGDFNFTPEARPYQLVTAFMQDVRGITKSLPYGPEATFNGFRFDKQPTRRIDYIFIKGNIAVSGYATLADSQNMAYPSDHFPVVADLQINGLVR